MFVYKFGAPQGPFENAALVEAQLRLARYYQNDLVAVELGRRGAVAATIRAGVRVVDAALAAAEAVPAGDEHKQARIDAWRAAYAVEGAARKAAHAVIAAETARVDAAARPGDEKLATKASAKQASADRARELAQARDAMPDESVVAQVRAIGVLVHAFTLLLRAKYRAEGLFWGTYLLVEQAVDASKKEGNPQFRRYDGCGRVGIQIQKSKPLTCDGMFAGDDTRLRVERVPDPPYVERVPGKNHTGHGRKPGGRRANQRAILRLRVGSIGRAPVWASWPVVLHRPMPPEAQVKWAWMQREKVGPDYRWALCVTVDASRVRPDPKVLAVRQDIIAVDLGWRARDDGLRVGYWRDQHARKGPAPDPEHKGEILLPAAVAEKLAHARSIGAIRDRAFNAFREVLAAWVDAQDKVAFPEWFRFATRTVRAWKSADRAAGFARRWGASRFDADATIYDAVLAWAKRDWHLHKWEAHETDKALARRNDFFRVTAAAFARRAATLVVEDFQTSKVVGRRGVGQDASDGEKVRADRASSNRHVVAPATFRSALENACASRGTTLVEVESAFSTIDCASCGARIEWDPAPQVTHRCPACGIEWDQDDQACVNLLARHASGGGTRVGRDPLASRESVRQSRFRSRRGDAVKEVETTDPVNLSQDGAEGAENMDAVEDTPAVPAHEA